MGMLFERGWVGDGFGRGGVGLRGIVGDLERWLWVEVGIVEAFWEAGMGRGRLLRLFETFWFGCEVGGGWKWNLLGDES